jgi:hypothetical protein
MPSIRVTEKERAAVRDAYRRETLEIVKHQRAVPSAGKTAGTSARPIRLNRKRMADLLKHIEAARARRARQS